MVLPAKSAVEEVEQPEPSPPPISASKPAPIPSSATTAKAAMVDLFGNKANSPSTSALQLPVFDSVVLSTAEKTKVLNDLNANQVSICTKCRLSETRTKTVFGEGSVDAKIMFIGEGPGENEDLQGRPFVGRAGELLNKWIAAMGLSRESVYIANIVKCRPPGNREPAPDETQTCTPYLVRQIEIIRPAVIITLGRPSSQYMLQTKQSMGQLRGNWFSWRGVKLLPTYHPAYVLRSYTLQTRSAVWSDLQTVMKELGLPLPTRARSE